MKSRELDKHQQQAVEAILAHPTVAIAGVPGSGRSTVIEEAVAALVERQPGVRVAVLCANRHAVAQMRSSITERHGGLPEGVSVRTAPGFAFHIVQAWAMDRGRGIPEVITGPDQDAILAELLAEDDARVAVKWPDDVPVEARETRAFRAEIRDLLTRAAELGLSPAELDQLGVREEKPWWSAGATLMAEYEEVLALADAGEPGGGGADRFDHARLVHVAARHMAADDWVVPEAKPVFDYVLVDDYQDATMALAMLLTTLARGGTRIVVAGDPDSGVQGFRGGLTHLLSAATDSAVDNPQAGLGANLVSLGSSYRGTPTINAVRRAIAQAIPTSRLVGHRDQEMAEEADGSVSAAAFRSTDQELTAIARAIRKRALVEGDRWDSMAVITRSRSSHQNVRRFLERAGIPVAPGLREIPLAQEPVASALLLLVDVAHRGFASDQEVLDLLTSPLFNVDASSIRSAIRGARALVQDLRVVGELSPDEMEPLSTVLNRPDEFPLEGRWAQPLRRLARIHRLVTESSLSPGATSETVLWAAWKAVDRAEEWREIALAGGHLATGAHHLLDVVMQLFRVAQRMVDRNPDATALDFTQAVRSQELPEDSIARRPLSVDAVALETPSSSVGRSWDHVWIMDLNEGSWPNLRIRDSILETTALVDIALERATGMSGAAEVSERRQAVLADELRMLHVAVSRARLTLSVCGTHGEEGSPSRFFTLLEKVGIHLEDKSQSELEYSLHGIAGKLRSILGTERVSSEESRIILETLDLMGREGIAGARPDEWLSNLTLSSTGRSVQGDVYLSPSKMEAMAECPARWFLTSAGAENRTNQTALSVGNIIHALAEEFPEGDLAAMQSRLAELWPAFARSLTPGYETVSERRRVDVMVEKLSKYLREKSFELAKVETEVHVRQGYEGTVVNGRIDRVEYLSNESNEVRLIDFKSGSKAITQDEASVNPQLMLYQWLMEREGYRPEGADLVYVGTKEQKAVWRSQGALTQDGRVSVEELLQTLGTIGRGETFVAIPGTYCKHCPVRTSCPQKSEGAVLS